MPFDVGLCVYGVAAHVTNFTAWHLDAERVLRRGRGVEWCFGLRRIDVGNDQRGASGQKRRPGRESAHWGDRCARRSMGKERPDRVVSTGIPSEVGRNILCYVHGPLPVIADLECIGRGVYDANVSYPDYVACALGDWQSCCRASLTGQAVVRSNHIADS